MAPRTLADLYAESDAARAQQAQYQQMAQQSIADSQEVPSVDVGTALMKLLAAGLPMAIAKGVSGDRAAGAIGQATGAGLEADNKNTLLRQEKERGAKLLEAKSYQGMAKGEGKRADDFNKMLLEPDIARQKGLATLDMDLMKSRAGASNNVNILGGDSGGPIIPLDTALTFATNPAAEFKLKEAAKQGIPITQGLVEFTNKSSPMSPDERTFIASNEATYQQMQNLRDSYNEIKELPAIGRLAADKLPNVLADWASKANQEDIAKVKLYSSQVGTLAMQMTREISGAQAAVKETDFQLARMPEVDAIRLLGDKKMDILLETYDLHRKLRAATIKSGPKVSESDVEKYRSNMSKLITGDDPLANLVKGVASNSDGVSAFSLAGRSTPPSASGSGGGGSLEAKRKRLEEINAQLGME